MAEAPASGVESPTSIRIVVVLPAPLGPRKPVTVPGSQRNDTSLTTLRPPRRLVSPVASIMGRSIGAAPLANISRRSIVGSTSVGGAHRRAGVRCEDGGTPMDAPGRAPAGARRREAY